MIIIIIAIYRNKYILRLHCIYACMYLIFKNLCQSIARLNELLCAYVYVCVRLFFLSQRSSSVCRSPLSLPTFILSPFHINCIYTFLPFSFYMFVYCCCCSAWKRTPTFPLTNWVSKNLLAFYLKFISIWPLGNVFYRTVASCYLPLAGVCAHVCVYDCMLLYMCAFVFFFFCVTSLLSISERYTIYGQQAVAHAAGLLYNKNASVLLNVKFPWFFGKFIGSICVK